MSKLSEADQFDEILWIDREEDTVIEDGKTKTAERVTFADGSTLELIATRETARSNEQIDKLVSVLELWTHTDYDEQTAAAASAQSSTAFGMLDEMIKLLRSAIPERSKRVCPTCDGILSCRQCRGAGCAECNRTGRCPTCDGRGSILVA
jgi:hypothetical protein